MKNKERKKVKNFDECPFCRRTISKKYSGLKDRLMTTDQSFYVSECDWCGAGILNPAPLKADKFYPQNYLSSEQDEVKAKKRNFDLEKWYRYNQYRYDFSLLERAIGVGIEEAKSYIDIGCGSGERVTFARDNGCLRSVGIDKFDFSKSQSKQEDELINSEILDYEPKKRFRVASLFHVLEHLHNPHETLIHIRESILADNGYLIIQVPNYGSIERRVFGRRWFGLDVPRHYWDFNPEAIKLLLEETGYRVEAIYQLNAPLHPVTIAPSIFRELDVQRIWVKQDKGRLYRAVLTILWAGTTFATIPLTILQNFFNRSSMLTVVASNR